MVNAQRTGVSGFLVSLLHVVLDAAKCCRNFFSVRHIKQLSLSGFVRLHTGVALENFEKSTSSDRVPAYSWTSKVSKSYSQRKPKGRKFGNSRLVLVTDRGGHLHNAKMLLEQCGALPAAILTTRGPEVTSLRSRETPVFLIPYLFTWFGKARVFNPLKGVWSFFWSVALCAWLRPRKVISFGAFDVVPFCLVARLLGAQIFHVECMNQVVTPSVTGRVLYPFCKILFVQWPELKKKYGAKAEYCGWVLK